MLGGKRDLVANALFLSLIGSKMQPSLWREVASNSFIENCFFEEIAVTQCESQYQRCLPLADGLQNL